MPWTRRKLRGLDRRAGAEYRLESVDTSPIDRKAPVERVWLDETSWFDLVRGFAREPEPLFARLLDEVEWRQSRVIRGGRKVDDPRLDGTLSVERAARYPALHIARLVLEARYRVRLGGVHLILYRDGRDGMGFHRDDELRYLDRTVIAGLALGATRPFALRPLRGSEVRSFPMAGGDLYVMGGRCQADWVHGVPKLEDCGPKISAVWRWAWKHGRPEPPSTWGP